jgi:hypothetical protein
MGGYPKWVAARLQAHHKILSGFAVVFPAGYPEGTFSLFVSDSMGRRSGATNSIWIPSVHNHEAFTFVTSPVLAI